MASLCKRQQCTIERRGFRQELDSWRHKLIHCVGKLFWYCVCVRVWRGPGAAERRGEGRGGEGAVFCAARLKRPRRSSGAVTAFCSARLMPPPDRGENIPAPSLCARRGHVPRRSARGFGACEVRGCGLEFLRSQSQMWRILVFILRLFVYCKQAVSRVQMERALSQSASRL